MLRIERTVLVLLAAGRSSRFDDAGSKLDAALSGTPLGLHAALTLQALPFLHRVAVVGEAALDYSRHGFETFPNPDRAQGMATSIRMGVRHAAELGADAVLIALADMPLVTAGHVRRLFDASEDATSVVASSDGQRASPPALFGAGRFDALLALSGDSGARDLIANGRHVVADPAELIDIDTRADLAALAAIRGGARRSD